MDARSAWEEPCSSGGRGVGVPRGDRAELFGADQEAVDDQRVEMLATPLADDVHRLSLIHI